MNIFTRLLSLLTNKKIKISVIIPVYNAEKHLHKCIDSILAQDIKPIEIIIVNDCSTDNSLELLSEYSRQSSSIKIINHTSNRGAGVARNNAIKQASGKYIVFVDSDDWFGNAYLECLYRKAETTKSDIVFSNMVMVNNKNEHKFEPFDHAFEKYKNAGVSLANLACDWRSTAPWMKLFRKDFIITNDLKFLEGIKLGAEDISFSWTAYFIAKKISFCDNVYYNYNLTPDSLDRCVNDNIVEIFDALDFTKLQYIRFDPFCLRLIQIDTLFITHIFYQFSKITTIDKPENVKLASVYWEKARDYLLNISKDHVLDNKYLGSSEKEYYFDVVECCSFNLEMQNKYFS